MGWLCTCRSEMQEISLTKLSFPSPTATPESNPSSVECFTLSPHLDEGPDQLAQDISWRQLLQGVPRPPGLRCPAIDALRRRHENAAWRHWWAAHQLDSVDQWIAHASLDFPSTPTSTFPGTPNASPRASFDHSAVAVNPMTYVDD